VSDLLASRDGLALARAFTWIKDPKLRCCITDVVVNIAEHPGWAEKHVGFLPFPVDKVVSA
jgi:hypothetical protein